ncbi:MAG: ABC transporter ATP-binding protein [Crocinitomicaceae bacterium]|nr:ABC transporter ATP-binding protein [Crocinitomicaceae bacterium]MDG1736238.1 ABC transporter ATP-binding protein [Crocinitomicaceae bacterium]
MMKSYLEIFRYTIHYKLHTFLVVLCNMFFVVFNLLSLVLFIPVLQLIFKDPDSIELVSKPAFNWGVPDIFIYVKDYYNYTMTSMVKSEPLNALLFVCISVMLAFFFKNLFRYGAVWFQSELRMAVVRDIRNKLFEKSMRLPLAYHTNERKGDLMSRMVSDVNEIEIAVVCLLELLFREPFAVLINIATLIYLSPSLSLFSFLLMPISAFVISKIGKSLKRTAKKSQEQTSVMYSSMDEGIEGVRIIKAFNAAAFIVSGFRKTNLKHQKLVTRTARKKNLSPLLNETIGAGVLLTLVWFGGRMILGGDENALSGEVFMTFIIVFSQFLRPVQNISKNISNMIKSRASQDRINQILDLDDVITDAPNASNLETFNSNISFENVGFKYDTISVLNGIDFKIQKGQNIALVGESGSGKTTLINLIPRFYDTTSGAVKIDGVDISSLRINDLRAKMALVSQDPILFNSSVIENIAFGDEQPDLNRVTEAAKIANAHTFITQMQDGYESIIGERGSLLSGGQKQRLSIARAMYKNPEILILDEATSALDLESEKLVQEALDRVMNDRTCIVIAHRLSTIRKSDLILVMDQGKVVERGSHEALLKENGFYKKLFDLQIN